ncbi:MAG: helix-turn-helix domain-containing protein [Alphaproteobacteria bacterium]|nr:helix-turn-helix domain-containing protein [Alphaproteobacteria bacterium]
MAKLRARPFSDLEAGMSKAALAESERIYARLREEMALGEIREAAGLSQEEMAERLKVNQAQVSRLEKRGDLKISTLARVVGALGGRLQVTAEFGGKKVTLRGLTPGHDVVRKKKPVAAKHSLGKVRSRKPMSAAKGARAPQRA